MFPSFRLITAALFATVLLAFTFVFVSARVAHDAIGQRTARAHAPVQETMLLSRDLVFVATVPQPVVASAAKSPVIGTYVVTPPETAARPEKSVAASAVHDKASERAASLNDAKTAALSDPPAVSKDEQKTALVAAAPDVTQGQPRDTGSMAAPAPAEAMKPAAPSEADEPGMEKSGIAKDVTGHPAATRPDAVDADALSTAAAAESGAAGDTANSHTDAAPPAAALSSSKQPETVPPGIASPKPAPSGIATAEIEKPTAAVSHAVASGAAEASVLESKPAQSDRIDTPAAESKAASAVMPREAEKNPIAPQPAPAAVALAAPQTQAIASGAAPVPAPQSHQMNEAPPMEQPNTSGKDVALLENQTAPVADASAATRADAAPNEVLPDVSAAGSIAHVPLPKTKPAKKKVGLAAITPVKPAHAKPEAKRKKAKEKAKAKPVSKPAHRVKRQIVRQAAPQPAPPPAPPPPAPAPFLFGN